ncbi:MAG: DegT/DnrJ/EryC1/StrS family aminotransferase [Halobacteriovoraceae bacterium]|nr:DegT/DnrJ/EryC1/StrS family aminotransferase [Halobacteriovoraceae bacterium]
MANRKIPFFNYPAVFTDFENELTKIFKDVGSRGAFILQQDLKDFEKNLAEFMGAKFAVATSNGTDALVMGLKAAGVKAGDEVIFSSHTFVATASAIHFVGAIPVPVECGEDHQISPDHVEKAITSKTKCIMPTQLNGRCCDMDRLSEIAKKHNLVIVEDAAQGLGAKFKGQCAGTFGAAAGMSFYPAKVLGGLGDAGAAFTNDEKIYRELILLRDHGRDPETGDVVTWGMNYRMDNLQAAFLNHKLKTYDKVMERRREIASRYNEGLKDLANLVLPPAPNSDERYFDIYQNYEIEAEKRDQLKTHLGEKGIGTLIQWGGKMVHQFTKLGFNQSLPFTEKVAASMLMLPINMSVTNDDIDYVIESIREFYKR